MSISKLLMRRDKDEEEKKQNRLRGLGNTSCRMVPDRNVGNVLCYELGIGGKLCRNMLMIYI